MPDHQVRIFAADNLFNPQNPGTLPIEDATFRSDLEIGDQITWLGGGTSEIITITDPTNDTFDEAQTDQTLAQAVTFNGTSYAAGQIVTPTYTIIFSDGAGNSYTLSSLNFDANNNGQEPDSVFWEGAIPPPGTVLTVTSEINPTRGGSRPYADFVVCFTSDVRILTPEGERPAGELSASDAVLTFDGETRVIRWIGRRVVTQAELQDRPNLHPIRIARGALGQGRPHSDLLVSPQHRLLAQSPIAARMLGTSRVLVAATALVGLPGITIDQTCTGVIYVHLLLDDHEILSANGAPAESLYLGPQAIQAMSPDGLEELRLLFPEVMAEGSGPPATPHAILSGRKRARFVERHRKNRKALLTA